MRYTVISWELTEGGESGDMKGGQACLAASQREGLIGKGGTRRKYSKR